MLNLPLLGPMATVRAKAIHHPLVLLLSLAAALAAAEPAPTGITVGVDSAAFCFSPGNWSGDNGRTGSLYRQTWTPNAYARITWETSSETPSAVLTLDASTYDGSFNPPTVAYEIDGVLKANISAAPEIPVTGFAKGGRHELVVYLQTSQQVLRWGAPGASGRNVLRITGLRLDAAAKPLPNPPAPRWALIVGDSITEGCGSPGLTGYAYLLGRSLRTQGYEFGINACGWSGWLHPGDNPPGDVPGYYVVSGSTGGAGGTYDDARSRWNRIDARTPLLDAAGRISAYGGTGQEPALILINYGTNDGLHKSNPSDTRAAIEQGLAALRKAAPDAQIVVLIPFNRFYAKELKDAVAAHRQSHPGDRRLAIIDLGDGVRRALDDGKANPEIVAPGEKRVALMGGLHPNERGHAYLAALITPQVLSVLAEDGTRK